MIDWRLPDPADTPTEAARLGGVAEEVARYRGYRVPSARLPGFDYASGWYFVTFVTRSRARWDLGRLCAGKMRLSRAGEIVVEEWERTGAMRPGVRLDAMAVLPDHVHAVIGVADGRVRSDIAVGRDAPRGVSTGDSTPATRHGPRDEWRPGVLGAVINHWKGACTRRIRADLDPTFGWQPRFYDVIIRDDRCLDLARRYTQTNAAHHASRGDYA